MSSTVAVTLVFTDLVGSTPIGTSLHPDDTERLRQTHFAILREAVAATGGNEVKNLDAMLGDHASAEANLRHALELHEHFGAVYWTARTQLDLAQVVDAPELVKAARLAIDRYGLEGLRPRLN